MLKITSTVFVILTATSAFCEEPAPAPSSAPVLAQSPPAGVIEAATPAAQSAAVPAGSPSATPAVGQASPAARPAAEPSPAAASSTPAPAPASTFSSSLLGGERAAARRARAGGSGDHGGLAPKELRVDDVPTRNERLGNFPV